MVDFWRWEYDYGHNLDPNAAIIVPGMAYQPPLIGFKQLLNFGAYSIPDTSEQDFYRGWCRSLGVVVFEWKRKNKIKHPKSALNLVIVGLLSMLFSSCNTEPEPLRIGKDNCDFCKMTISDSRFFGAPIVTNKGKKYKFDDQHCLSQFLYKDKVKDEDIASVYFVDFNEPHDLINARMQLSFKALL